MTAHKQAIPSPGSFQASTLKMSLGFLLNLTTEHTENTEKIKITSASL